MPLVLQLLLFIFISQITCFLLSNSLECKINTQDPSKVAYTITVSQSDGGNFTTITDALNSIPSGNDKWIKISISPGTYKEQIQIQRDKQCIVLQGQNRSTTTITFDAHDSTLNSITFAVYADNFVAREITFRNSYNLENGHVPAVAFRGGGDKQAFYSCGFEGYQDTLWDDKGRHYFASCYIKGAVDFIWGDGQSFYKGCVIDVIGGGFITAQGREVANDTSGYVFMGCDIIGTSQTYLGRPYREFARVIFIESKFSDIIHPEGWDTWHKQTLVNDTTFAEVNCTGPGADTSKRVPWMKVLSNSEVEKYTTAKDFIDQEGWIDKLPRPTTLIFSC